MSSTTQILFNSPALHSLKRDQLVKLCKLHSLKANGKNTELIDRLKHRATELSELGQIPDDISEEDADALAGIFSSPMPRPSEQWEIVMDDIEEMDEANGTLTSMGTLRSKGNAGEFGTNGSKSSVTSSLKAIASSFGLTSKRAVVDKSTVASTSSAPAMLSTIPDASDEKATPELSNPFRPAPQSDSPEPEPIPGNPSRPGMPAPANARLSTGTGITTTVRLISTSFGSPVPSPPRLAPYQTTFDLDMGTPDTQGPGRSLNVWPASPGTAGRLYPAIPYEDLKPTPLTKFWAEQASKPNSNVSTPSKVNAKASQPMPLDLPDMFSPSKAPDSAKKPAARISTAQDKPFLFGSPLPQHTMTNKDFGHAASSILEEMNKRLAEAGVKKVDERILSGADKGPCDVFGIPAKPTHKKTDSGDRFEKVHENAFNKMDSIATHYAARRVLQPGQVAGTKKRKSEALGAATAPAAKRKSTVASYTGTRVISNGVRKNMGIPGGFGEDEDDEEAAEEDAGDRRASKRIRVVEAADVHKGRRISLLPAQQDQTEEEREKEERRKERERDAVKRKLAESKARRRSSRGRVSVGGKAVPPPKPSRFGFLASAKSIVRNVWNMGAAGNKAPSSIPPPKTTISTAHKAPAGNVAGSSKGHVRVPSGSTLLKPTSSSVAKAQATQQSSISSSQTRPPIPSFNGKSSITESVASRNSRAPTPQTGTATSKVSVKPNSTAGPSSMGTKKNVASSAHSNVSSMGARKSFAPHAAAGSTKGTSMAGDSSKKRTVSSTLMAPTASSLARRHDTTAAGDKGTSLAPSGGPRRFASPSNLQPITNGLAPRSPTSPRPMKIFSRPLEGFGSPSPEPEATSQSLGGAATTLLGRSSENARPQTRPKVLVARKPRISRSRVIAKLGAQRAAGTSVAASIKPAARTRSSIGAAPRQSLGVKKNRVSGGDMLMSAKKKARQTEYARRRSQIVASSSTKLASPRAGSGDVTMEIDG